MDVVKHCYIGSINDSNKFKLTDPETPTFCSTCVDNVTCGSKTFFIQAIVQEILGSFITVLFFMMQTEDSMLFSRERALNCFIIASGYVSARAMFFGSLSNGALGEITKQISSFGACLNPAIALGIMLSSVWEGGWSAIRDAWLYPTMPFAGSVLALIFFEFVYKKT